MNIKFFTPQPGGIARGHEETVISMEVYSNVKKLLDADELNKLNSVVSSTISNINPKVLWTFWITFS